MDNELAMGGLPHLGDLEPAVGSLPNLVEPPALPNWVEPAVGGLPNLDAPVAINNGLPNLDDPPVNNQQAIIDHGFALPIHEALPTLDADPQDHLSLHQPLAVPTGEAIGHELPQLPELCFCANGHELPHPQSDMSNPAVGGSSMKRSRTSSKKICKTRTTRTSNKTRHSECIVVSGGDGSLELPEIQPLAAQPKASEAIGGPAVGRRKQKRIHKAETQLLASKSIHWRQLPYMRTQALDDVSNIAAMYGSDLLGLLPVAEWLDIREARRLLDNSRGKQWWYRLGKEGTMESFGLGDSVDLMEIFSGCGHLTCAAAKGGLKVGPSVDWRPGLGHADACVLDLRSASDRRIVWALIVVLSPTWLHLGFPCTFWVAISHWTRTRDLQANEASRLEALMFIQFSRQCVHYQASRRRHSSLENPPRSVAWDLDIVQDMVLSADMDSVVMDLCAWGAKDPVSGRYYQKSMKFACTFSMQPLARKCPQDHEHEPVQGTIREGPFKGRHRSALSGRYPVPLCEAWVSLVALG